MKDTVLGFAKRKRRGKERNLTYIVVCEKEREKNCPPFWLRSKIFKRRKDDLCVKTVLSTYWRDENSSLISSVRETFLPFFFFFSFFFFLFFPFSSSPTLRKMMSTIWCDRQKTKWWLVLSHLGNNKNNVAQFDDLKLRWWFDLDSADTTVRRCVEKHDRGGIISGAIEKYPLEKWNLVSICIICSHALNWS